MREAQFLCRQPCGGLRLSALSLSDQREVDLTQGRCCATGRRSLPRASDGGCSARRELRSRRGPRRTVTCWPRWHGATATRAGRACTQRALRGPPACAGTTTCRRCLVSRHGPPARAQRDLAACLRCGAEDGADVRLAPLAAVPPPRGAAMPNRAGWYTGPSRAACSDQSGADPPPEAAKQSAGERDTWRHSVSYALVWRECGVRRTAPARHAGHAAQTLRVGDALGSGPTHRAGRRHYVVVPAPRPAPRRRTRLWPSP